MKLATNKRGPSTSRRAWAELANEGASDGARLSYEGSHPFGGETVHRWRFGNGLTVLVLIDASAPIVSYHTWFKVGSRHERPGKTGLAHLFEHLMFNETENLRAGMFDRKLEESGAETNAATWVDWTYYYESLPADRVKLAVRLEAERMARLVLREPQVASEKDVVANERRYRVDDDVEGAASELLYKTAFERHPYGWPTIGWMEDIRGFSPDDCVAFYRTYYAPNNATVVVVGDVRERDLLLAMRASYGSVPSQAIPPEDIVPEPPQREAREVETRKPTATEKLLLAYKGPALGDADHATMTVLSEVLFGGRASRVFRALVIEHELATDIRGSISSFRDPGLFECLATARPGRTARQIQAVMDRPIRARSRGGGRRRRACAGKGSSGIESSAAARDDSGQGGTDRLLRNCHWGSFVCVPSRRRVPAHDRERYEACCASLFRRGFEDNRPRRARGRWRFRPGGRVMAAASRGRTRVERAESLRFRAR